MGNSVPMIHRSGLSLEILSLKKIRKIIEDDEESNPFSLRSYIISHPDLSALAEEDLGKRSSRESEEDYQQEIKRM